MAKKIPAAEYFKRFRDLLLRNSGVTGQGGKWQNPLGVANVMDPLGTTMRETPGAVTLPRGVSPSDADVMRLINLGGGMPGGSPRFPMARPGVVAPAMGGFGAPADGAAMQARTLAAQAPGNDGGFQFASPADALMWQVIADAVGADKKARDETLKRYDESKGIATARKEENASRMENWGKVQETLNNERAAQALGAQQVQLAGRGLSNSTALTNAMARNARDLALTQQDLSERKDDRAIQIGSRDDERLMALIGSRNDTSGMDMNMVANLLMQFGKSGGGQANKVLRDQIDKLNQQVQSLGSGGGRRGGGGGGAMPIGMRPWQLQQLQASLSGLGIPQPGLPPELFSGWGPNTSNRYPTPRGSISVADREAAYEAAIAEKAARAELAKRAASLHRRKSNHRIAGGF